MQYFRHLGALFGFVLAVATSASSIAVASTFSTSANAASQNAVTRVDQFLSLSVSDSASQPSAALTSVDDTLPSESRLLAYTPQASHDQLAEFDDVVRHRGLPKFLLLVFICGALIRFFTSPIFLKFITDALDPKAW